MSARSLLNMTSRMMLLVLFLGIAVVPAAGGSEGDFAPGEILVRFNPDVGTAPMLQFARDVGATVLRTYRIVDGLAHIELPPGLSVEEAIKLYASDPRVVYAEPNFRYRALPSTQEKVPDDPEFSKLWGLHTMDAPKAWDLTTGDRSAVVFVVDTGGDYEHEDLADNRWPNLGYSTIGDSSDPMDDNGHGTHVTGTIGAVGDNQLGVVGVNWETTIGWAKFLDHDGWGYTSDAVKCLEYILDLKVNHGVNVVATNNSWGGSGNSRALLEAIVAHRENGILFIAAAGNSERDNDTKPEYPASYREPGIISVASSTAADGLSPFSNYGKKTVHVAAPGSPIYSTLPGNNYGYKSGTSMATAHVTGLVALLAAQDPARDWRALRNLVFAGGEAIAAADGKTITGRRINAHGSMVCDGTRVEAVLRPLASSYDAKPGETLLFEYLSIECADPIGPVEVSISGPVSGTVALKDDGSGPDLAAGDGVFASTWTVPAEGYGVYELGFPNGETVTVNVEAPPSATAGHGVALYDQEHRRYYIKHQATPGPADETFPYGPLLNSWLPVAGDWTGDGVYGVALYDQANRRFYIKYEATPGPADMTFIYGPMGNNWIPVAGDWTGDGVYGVALYDQANRRFYIKYEATPGPADMTFIYGPLANNWLPVVGDWTGDGVYGVALYDQINRRFYIKHEPTPGPADVTFIYGPLNNAWLPVAGNWDGSGGVGENLFAGPTPGATTAVTPQAPGTSLHVSASPNPVGTDAGVTFRVLGREVDAVQVAVYDLAGALVFRSDFASGSTVNWNLASSRGLPVANGIYLFTVTAKSDGELLKAPIDKLLVLR